MSTSKMLLYLQYIAILELKGKDYRVLLYLLSDFLKWSRPIKISQKDIAYELSMSKSDVSKALKHLVEMNILQIDEDLSFEKKKKKFYLVEYTEEELYDLVSVHNEDM